MCIFSYIIQIIDKYIKKNLVVKNCFIVFKRYQIYKCFKKRFKDYLSLVNLKIVWVFFLRKDRFFLYMNRKYKFFSDKNRQWYMFFVDYE